MRSIRRVVLAVVAASVLATLSLGVALGGEITGNGRLLEVKGKSECAFSGQEDLQWFTNDFQEERRENPVKGEPAHAQSWGQIPKEVRDFIAAEFGAHPGNACNPHRSGAH